MADTLHHPTFTRTVTPLARRPFGITTLLLAWQARRAGRRALARLDPHILCDIGLSAADAGTEAAKPFWRE